MTMSMNEYQARRICAAVLGDDQTRRDYAFVAEQARKGILRPGKGKRLDAAQPTSEQMEGFFAVVQYLATEKP